MTDDRLHRDRVPVGIDAPVMPTAVGIVHLGIGAFHRAHQAVYTERAAIATGDTSWGILGVTQRSATSSAPRAGCTRSSRRGSRSPRSS